VYSLCLPRYGLSEIVRVDVDTYFYANVLVAVNYPKRWRGINVTITGRTNWERS